MSRAGVRLAASLTGSLLTLVLIGSWFLMKGEPSIGMSAMIRSLFDTDSGGDTTYLVQQVRLPRLLLGTLCGVALGLAGCLLQYTLRNPIADPSLLGISQSAMLVVALSTLFPGLVPAGLLPIACLVAGLVAGGLLVILARSIRDPVRLILMGVIIASLGTTLTSAVIILLPEARTIGLGQYFGFTAGTVASATWQKVGLLLPWLAVAIPAALFSGRALNLLQLGDEVAIGRGMRVTRSRTVLLACAVVLVAPVVAVIGPISFVALLSPHVAKAILGTANAHLVLPASGAIGAVALVVADAAGRLLFFPVEIPAGVWTIIVVGPIAVWLARRAGHRAAQEA